MAHNTFKPAEGRLYLPVSVDLSEIESLLFRIDVKVDQLLSQGEKAMALIDDVVADVHAQKTVTDSAVALLMQLKAALDAACTDPAKLQEVKDLLDANTKEIADAVTANTPAVPPP